ncbi:hypothetical protein Mapa_017324 [Marchantia paleacea]|nr:hypothetical protein Mapa_017324 [Marchantia paleacea]
MLLRTRMETSCRLRTAQFLMQFEDRTMNNYSLQKLQEKRGVNRFLKISIHFEENFESNRVFEGESNSFSFSEILTQQSSGQQLFTEGNSSPIATEISKQCTFYIWI